MFQYLKIVAFLIFLGYKGLLGSADGFKYQFFIPHIWLSNTVLDHSRS